MPIKAENRHRYPADWAQIRVRILKRAGGRCELCGAPDGHAIIRNPLCPALWTDYGWLPPREPLMRGQIRVVLTIAHLDQSYRRHDDACLLALCQRCHLKIDAPFRGRKPSPPGES